MERERENEPIPKFTSIYLTALDGALNVNSLFMLAVFLGLAWNPFDPNYSLIDDDRCFPGVKVAEDLISFHVFSFASFLFSSLIALSLKQALKISRRNSSSIDRGDITRIMKARINKTFLRVGILAISAGSVFGCGFLVLAMINVVQLKLGVLSCPNSNYSISAIVPLVIFVPGALLIYVCLVLYAFTR
ncbi:maternal effect embryo arrest [Thalictrum thalictroides]|uniref:Maternal effect embryo arrest n=1 Tax=Thalictrum thalictroides TaxID=46969 RepID=A0A7J6WF69_THATH|nr:maternal effect embryo arrest [Thalictrum thalictroides]